MVNSGIINLGGLMTKNKDKSIGALVGLAVGDALGASVEFLERNTFIPVTEMIGGGIFNLNPGEWTDDTSMALALADSLLSCKTLDCHDLLCSFYDWYVNGEYSHNGLCFDIGSTTVTSIEYFNNTGKTNSLEVSQNRDGNGSIMRLAPIPIAYYDLDRAIEAGIKQGNTTHASISCVEACRELTTIIHGLLNSKSLEDVINVDYYKGISRNDISSCGLAQPTLNAAKWAVARTTNFRDAITLAVNLGDDSDTVGAVTGQIAGALYGYSSIPSSWLSCLSWHEYIRNTAEELYELKL